jgi:5'-3' exonuclease
VVFQAEKLKEAGINPRSKLPYQRGGAYTTQTPAEKATKAALKAAEAAAKRAEKEGSEKETNG